jgi:hypothetical protein
MYKTIKEVLQLTTLSKPQVDRNYYKLPLEYKEQELIKLNKGIREVHDTIIPELITRRRKRDFTEKDIKAILYNDWSYFGTVKPYGKTSVEYCKVLMNHLFMHLVEKHKAKVKLIYFIEDPSNQTHVHYLIQVTGMVNVKPTVEIHLRKISECNTHFVKYDAEQGERCKDYITKDLLTNQDCWGYLES